MKDIVKDMGLDDKTFPAKAVLNAISKEKDNMTTPAQLLQRAEEANDLRLLHIARAYSKYQTRLKENNALDFDDILCVTVRLLQEHDDVRTYYQRKFRYVLVDEYQDTNHVQYLLTSLLAGGHENICVVGDDDQSIYRFRGATIENILSFEQQYRGARVIRLEQNYRSTQSILNAANSVISHNLGRKGKRLWTANSIGDPITVYEAYDETAEANYVAGRIISGSKGKNFKDYAVLYRTNAQSNALEFAFKRNGIPYRVIGGLRFFDRKEIKDLVAYLSVINNTNDTVRLKRIINEPKRGIGDATVAKAEEIANGLGISLYEVLQHAEDYPLLAGKKKALAGFTDLIDNLIVASQETTLPLLVRQVIDDSGYMDMLRAMGFEGESKIDNVQELVSSAAKYEEGSEEPSLQGYLEDIALADMVLRALDHSAVLFFIEQRCDLALEPSALFLRLFAVLEQSGELMQLFCGSVVAVAAVLDAHVCDKNDFLPHVVKGDDLVEEHEVDVLERLAVLDLALYAGLAVAEVVVGEVAYQTACERRKVIKARALVFRQKRAEIV